MSRPELEIGALFEGDKLGRIEDKATKLLQLLGLSSKTEIKSATDLKQVLEGCLSLVLVLPATAVEELKNILSDPDIKKNPNFKSIKVIIVRALVASTMETSFEGILNEGHVISVTRDDFEGEITEQHPLVTKVRNDLSIETSGEAVEAEAGEESPWLRAVGALPLNKD